MIKIEGDKKDNYFSVPALCHF